MDSERIFSKETILNEIQTPENFDQAREFIISSGIIQYHFDDSEKEVLSQIIDPKEFAFKYMELGIQKWFLLTRGE